MNTPVRRALLFVGVLLFVSGGSYFAGAATAAGKFEITSDMLSRTHADRPLRVPGFDSAQPCISEDEAQCWRRFYDAIVARYGSVKALHDLAARYEEGGYPRYFCHALLHDIGAAAGREYGDVGAAYQHGLTFCRAGYYHGVLEGIFGEDVGGVFLNNLDSVCASMQGKERYSYNYFSCVHGIGHGLMAYFGHDVFDSLEGCRKLSGEWEQQSCWGGVFMENVISDSPETPSRYLSAQDLLYPCTEVPDAMKSQCYAMQSSHVLAQNGGDFSEAFVLCGSVESKHQTTCYESIGRDASGWSYGSASRVAELCRESLTREGSGACIRGAAIDFIQSVGFEEARALCVEAEVGEALCREVVEWHIGFSQ